MGSEGDKRDGNGSGSNSAVPSQRLPAPWVGARMGNKSKKIAI